jgi:rhodanese-related sulfurtransferase
MKHSEGFLKIVDDAKTRICEISIPQVRSKMEAGHGLHLIDVREDHEWALGHSRGAKHLSKGIIERDIENLISDHHAEIILYCGGGFRSALAADNLQRMGYTRVWSMAGGFRSWKEANMPVVTDL